MTENKSDAMCSAAFAPNEYFTKKLSTGNYLVTTRHRQFAFLDSEEYNLLYRGGFQENKELFEKLEKTGIIFTEKNIKKIVGSFEKQYLFLFFPKSFRINLSNECNLLCSYCLSNATPSQHETMSEELMDATIKFMLSAPGRKFYVEFQGGEPLAKFNEIKKFVEKIKIAAEVEKKEIEKIVIVTNLTLMTEEIAKYLLENNIGLCSSLDGPEELHDIHRKFGEGGGTYKTVTKWLSYFRERGRTINTLPTITSHSIKIGARKIIDEYVWRGCIRIPVRAVIPVGRAKQNDKLSYSAEEFIIFWKDAVEYMTELTLKDKTVFDPNTQAMLRNMMDGPMSYMCMRKPCGGAISHMSISCDGTIMPCDLSKTLPEMAIGNVRESYLDVALRTISMNARTSDFQPLCNTCAFGPYCGNCYTRTRAVFSDETPRTPRDFECKVNKAMFIYLFEKLQDEKYAKVFRIWINGR